MRRIIEVIAHESGALTVEYEEICAMTGTRMRWLVHYLAEDGSFYRAMRLGLV